MARGYIFHLTTDHMNMGSMSEACFYEDIGSLNADFVKDMVPESAKDALQRNVIDMLRRIGFRVDAHDNQDGEHGFVVRPMDENRLAAAKALYFAPRLEQLKKIVSKATVDEFAGLNLPDDIMSLVNDRHHDMVYFGNSYGETLHTMDQFIRRMAINTEYYVSANVVLVH